MSEARQVAWESYVRMPREPKAMKQLRFAGLVV